MWYVRQKRRDGPADDRSEQMAVHDADVELPHGAGQVQCEPGHPQALLEIGAIVQRQAGNAEFPGCGNEIGVSEMSDHRLDTELHLRPEEVDEKPLGTAGYPGLDEVEYGGFQGRLRPTRERYAAQKRSALSSAVKR